MAERNEVPADLLRRALRNHDAIAAALRSGINSPRLILCIEDMRAVKAKAADLGCYKDKRPAGPEKAAKAETRCRVVVEDDDSIGGEGEIRCGKRLLIKGAAAVCEDDHRLIACQCVRSDCWGWRVADWDAENDRWKDHV